MTDDKCGSTRGHEYLHTEMMTTLDKSVYSFIVRMRLMKITFLTSIFKDKRIRLNYRRGGATHTQRRCQKSKGNGKVLNLLGMFQNQKIKGLLWFCHEIEVDEGYLLNVYFQG